MRTPYTLRRATSDDGQAILAAPRLMLARLPAVATTVDAVAWWRAPASALDALIAAGRYYIAEQDGGLLGGVGWEPHARIGDTAVLRSVFLDPAHRSHELAARMMRVAEAAALTAGFRHILVPAAPGAVGFYRGLGYVGADSDDLVLEAGLRVAYRRMWKHAA